MKFLRAVFSACALCLLLAPAAGAVTASSQTQMGNLVSNATLGISSNRAGESSALTIDLSHSLTTGEKPPPSVALTVATDKGTKLNANIVKTCDFSELQTTGSCPSNTRLGKGSGVIDVRTGGIDQLSTNDVVPYKIANSQCSGLGVPGIKFCGAVHAIEATTGTVADIIVGATTSGGRVTVHIPSYSLPEILGIKPILTQGRFVLDKGRTVKKKVKGKQKKSKVKEYLLTNPATCNKSWTITETRTYEGIGEVSTETKLPCRKAKKR